MEWSRGFTLLQFASFVTGLLIAMYVVGIMLAIYLGLYAPQMPGIVILLILLALVAYGLVILSLAIRYEWEVSLP